LRDRLYITFNPPYVAPVQGPQPETIAYLDAVGIVDDGTVYFTGTAQETTGALIWGYLDTRVVNIKNLLGLPLNVDNLGSILGYWYPRISVNTNGVIKNIADISRYSGTLFGGYTISSTGILYNGTNGYMSTGATMKTLNTNVGMSNSKCAYGIIVKTNVSGTYVDFGALDNSGGLDTHIALYSRNGSGNMVMRNFVAGVNYNVAVANSLGHCYMVRDTTTQFKAYKDTSLLLTQATAAASTSYGLEVITEGALNNDGSIIQYAPREYTSLWCGCVTPAEALLIDIELRGLDTDLNR